MLAYWTLSIVVILIQLFPSKSNRHYNFRIIISLIPLFLYGAFRINYGLDYYDYEDYFDSVKIFGLESDERMEIGFFYLNQILPSFRSLLILQTILLCIAYYYLFKWYIPAKWSWLGFLLLVLTGPQTIFFMLSSIRNSIAISIFILSTIYIYNRNFIQFALLILLAFFFHNSVILYAPIAYFLMSKRKITKKFIVFWFSGMLFLSVASNTIILEYINVFISTYLQRYSSYIEFAREQGKGAGTLATIFSFLSTVILYLNFKESSLDYKENMIIKLSMLFFIAFLFGPLNLRMTQYFAPFFIVGSVLVFYKSSKRFLKYAYILAVFVYIIYSFWLWKGNQYFSYDVYESVLF